MPKVAGDLSVGDGGVGFGMHIPDYDPVDCGGRGYLPVGIEVRIASRDEVDFNQSCAALLASKFADCFRDISLIRVWDDGNPNAHPLIKEVTLTGGCASPGGRLLRAVHGSGAVGARTCNYGAGRQRRLRQPLSGKHELQGPGERRRPRSSQRRRGQPDRHVDHQRHPAAGDDRAAGQSARDGRQPGQGQGLLDTARAAASSRIRPATAPGRSSSRRTSARRTRRARSTWRARRAPASSSGLPSSPLDNVTDGNKDVTVFPSIGIRSVLRPGIFTTLRTESSQGSQLVACDPSVASGQEFQLFNGGCQPWFGENPVHER